MPEHLFILAVSAMLGWGGFTWRRSEHAVDLATKAGDRSDRLELKLAEKYLSKQEFELQMERLFTTLHRFEQKLDFHVYTQTDDINKLRQRLQQYENRDNNGIL